MQGNVFIGSGQIDVANAIFSWSYIAKIFTSQFFDQKKTTQDIHSDWYERIECEAKIGVEILRVDLWFPDTGRKKSGNNTEVSPPLRNVVRVTRSRSLVNNASLPVLWTNLLFYSCVVWLAEHLPDFQEKEGNGMHYAIRLGKQPMHIFSSSVLISRRNSSDGPSR